MALRGARATERNCAARSTAPPSGKCCKFFCAHEGRDTGPACGGSGVFARAQSCAVAGRTMCARTEFAGRVARQLPPPPAQPAKAALLVARAFGCASLRNRRRATGAWRRRRRLPRRRRCVKSECARQASSASAKLEQAAAQASGAAAPAAGRRLARARLSARRQPPARRVQPPPHEPTQKCQTETHFYYSQSDLGRPPDRFGATLVNSTV